MRRRPEEITMRNKLPVSHATLDVNSTPLPVLILHLNLNKRLRMKKNGRRKSLRYIDDTVVLKWILATLSQDCVSRITFSTDRSLHIPPEERYRARVLSTELNNRKGYLELLVSAGDALKHGGILIDAKRLFRRAALERLLATKDELILGYEPVPEGTRATPQCLGLKDGLITPLDEPGSVPVYFSGIFRVDERSWADMLAAASSILAAGKNGNLRDVVLNLLTWKRTIHGVNITRQWAKINRPSALARFVFGTKAETLARLDGKLSEAVILPQRNYRVDQWLEDSEGILDEIREKFNSRLLVVRSSALSEDSFNQSNAGNFTSVLKVNGADREQLRRAFEEVVESFGRKGDLCGADQVLVQPYLENVVLSGVLFSRDLESGAPYTIVNYDEGPATDGVTGGKVPARTVILFNRKWENLSLDPRIERLNRVARELEKLTGLSALDVEFAFDSEDNLFLFQVRPLVQVNGSMSVDNESIDQELENSHKFLTRALNPQFGLLGEKGVLSNMTDWNPAEMLGHHPHPLALSLYKHLVTDRIWAIARKEVGYRDLTPTPLMVTLSGHPYIDVRASLNSFIPDSIDEALAEKLANYYLRYLRQRPHLHDKVEFEVAVTCLDFDFERHRKTLVAGGFSDSEIEQLRMALRDLTDDLISQVTVCNREQLNQQKKLEQIRQQALNKAEGNEVTPQIIVQLLEATATLGTLPFSKLARNGFIALTMLRSLKNRGILKDAEIELIQRTIPTVATKFSQQATRLRDGVVCLDDFIEEFGHLRPSSYNILAPNYTENMQILFGGEQKKTTDDANKNRKIREEENTQCLEDLEILRIFNKRKNKIQNLIDETGFSFTVEQLGVFISESIQGREQGKFNFTRALDTLLQLVKRWGVSLGLTLDQIAMLTIDRLIESVYTSNGILSVQALKREAQRARQARTITEIIRLPGILLEPDEVYGFTILEDVPNFVTNKVVRGDTCVLTEGTAPEDICGKILVLPNADPGYDWIFFHKPLGLITQYGGMASHMMIRASEFQLPSAIGCGELIYSRIMGMSVLELDCASRTIRPLG